MRFMELVKRIRTSKEYKSRKVDSNLTLPLKCQHSQRNLLLKIKSHASYIIIYRDDKQLQPSFYCMQYVPSYPHI